MSANAESVSAATVEAEAPVFVINLCASTTPVALVQPNSPELKRYTFFVTRRREEGRERFRLHMGYFPSLQVAEGLLAAVREVYPAAWVGPAPGPAPGHRASSRASSASASQTRAPAMTAVPTPARAEPNAQPAAAGPAPGLADAPAAPPVAAAPRAPEISQSVPTLSARVEPPLTLAAPGAVMPSAAPPADAVAAAPEAPMELTLMEDVPRTPHKPSGEAALEEMSNVREVLALLGAEPPAQTRPAAAPKPAAAAAPMLEPAQALKLLEEGPARTDLADTAIRMVTPEDTQTLRDIKLDTQNKAPPCFAVQLVWSVTPIDMATLPQLAIFSAYTLYHVEGNRQGRRWYGVRLGFFTDAHSAKQVAYYMKADYSAVVVVPVAVKERERASAPNETAVAPAAVPLARPVAGAGKAAPSVAGAKGKDMQGFELLPPELDVGNTSAPEPLQLAAAEDGPPQPVRIFGNGTQGLPPSAPAGPAPAPTPPRVNARPAKKPGGKRVVARTTTRRAEPGQAQALESTLEVLGASTLTLDEDRVRVTDPALGRSPEKSKPKSGLRFSKLLGRLTEKLGDGRR